MRSSVAVFSWLAVACSGSATSSNTGPDPVPSEAAASVHSTPRIDDEATWDRLASRPRNHHIARTTVVKFVIDLHEETPRFHFVESSLYESHFEFVSRVLAPGEFTDGYDFYRRVYRVDDRPYVVGSIIRYEDAGAWTFELISGDTLSGERILRTFEQLGARCFFGGTLRFRPTSDVHMEHVAGLVGRLPIANDDELYGAMQYQPLQLGVAFGRLRVVRGPVVRGRYGPRDVLVTDEVPDDLPICAALVTGRFQAPLAHVAVLSGNRGTPDMALRGAVDRDAVTALDGQLVRLEVGAQDYTLGAATERDAERFWARAPTRPSFEPPLSEERRELVDQCALGFDDVATAGAKAANMGVLCRLRESGVRVPAGFVVPLAHYMRHLRRNGLDRRVAAFLSSDARGGDPTAALAELQRAIARAPVDPALLRAVRERVRALAPNGRVRFRSSTNAEDLPGFNGAGLYSSRALSADASDEELADGLRYIWGSVWNLGAFQERELYRIAHERVAMAVLIQYSVDDAHGNGVAITANPYDRVRPGVLINIQASGASVTGAHGDQIPEQWLVFTYLPAREPELIARSSLSPERPILRREEVLDLTRQLEAIHAVFAPRMARDGSNAVDVEMLLAGEDRHFVLVQARPYRVAWQGRE